MLRAMDISLPFGVIIFLVCLAGKSDSEYISRPAMCSSGGRLKVGHKYEYRYVVTTTTGLMGASKSTTSSQFSCRAVVTVPRQCEVLLQVLDCELRDGGPSDNLTINAQSDHLAKELSRYPVYLQYDSGEVIDQQMLVFKAELQHTVNIKRGIISLLQQKVLPADKEHYSNPISQYDIFGSCQAHVSFPSTSDEVVETFRDLATCNLTHISNRQIDLYSFIKTVRGGHNVAPIAEMTYPCESSVTCQHSLTSTSTIRAAHCIQKQIYLPLSSGDDMNGLPSTKINQSMELISETPLLSHAMDSSLTDRHWVDMAMEFDGEGKVVDQGQSILEGLKQTVVMFLGQETNGQASPAESFRKLLDVMRTKEEEEVMLVRDAVFACRNFSCPRHQSLDLDSDMLRSIEERLFLNALASCGTEPCLTVFAECLRDDLIADFEAKSVVYDIGLFYQPSVKVTSIILEHCRKKNTPGCWLSVSSMINHLTHEAKDDSQVDHLVFDTVSHLHQKIGDKCQKGVLENLPPPAKVLAEEEVLTVIKAIINIGEAVGELDGSEMDDSKSVRSALLDCVKNEHISFIIARAAAQGLRKAGLLPSTASELLHIAEDETRPVVLRIAIIDILISYDDEATLRSLLDILDQTRLENIQTYVVTRVSSVMESFEPEHQRLRQTLGELLKERVLPELGDNILSKSHFTQYSHCFTLPLTSLNVGGYLAVDLVYTPTSSVFHSITVKFGLIADIRTTHLFEATVDLEGMDTFLKIMNEGKKAHSGSNIPTSPLEILDLLKEHLQKVAKSEIPDFAHYSNKVKLALMEIFRLANVQRVSFPHAHLSFKILDHEVAWFSTDSMLMMMKQLQKKGDPMKQLTRALAEGINSVLLRAFTLFDFHRVLPTVSGFPLETHVDTSVVTKALVEMKSDFQDYAKNGKHIVTDLMLKPSMSVFLRAQMKVTVGNCSSLGLSMTAVGVGVGGWTGQVRFLPVRTSAGGGHDLQVTRNLGQEQFQFLTIRSDWQLVRNGQKHTIGLWERGDQLEKCLPDIYTRMFGHKVCLSGVCQQSSPSSSGPSFLLTGPFKLEGTFTPIDSNLDHFSMHIKYLKKLTSQMKVNGYSMELVFRGPGTELSRQVSVLVDQDYSAGAMKVMANVPDAGLEYIMERIIFSSATYHHKRIASILSQHGIALNSVIVEKSERRIPKQVSPPGHELMEFDETEETIHLNVSWGRVSLDLRYRNYAPVPTYTEKDIVLSYYCDPSLRLLYALHPVPQLAAVQGHRSNFSYHQESSDSKTSFADTWKGLYKMVVLIPGQNITQITDMVADLQGAHRLTDIFWTYGNEMDYINMDAIVHNRSTHDVFKFDYSMNVDSEDKFLLDLEGHVLGPRSKPFANMYISTDIRYDAKEDARGKRSKRSLDSMLTGLDQMKTTVEEKAKEMFEAAKSKLFSLWRESDPEEESEESSTPQTSTTEPIKKEVDYGDEEYDDEMDEFYEEQDDYEEDEDIDDAEDPEDEYKPFWKLSHWNIGIDANIRMLPHMSSTSDGKKKMSGVEVQWNLNTSAPRNGNELLRTNGSVFKGHKKWMKIDIEDHMHNMKFKWQAEHFFTPMVVHHHHNWTLIETNRHSFDRSFNMRIDFEHYHHLEYDVILRSPRTNFTHHINYTKISEGEHIVRAHARVHSIAPAFDLVYYESSDVIGRDLITHINLTSTFLDHHFDLTQRVGSDGLTVNGELHLDGRLPLLKGERTVLMSLVLARRRPPLSEWTYLYPDGSGAKMGITMLGPTQIKINVQEIPNSDLISADDLESSVTWLLKLVEPRRMEHTIKLSPQMLGKVQHMAGMLQKMVAYKIRNVGEMTAHNIVADLKDKKLPFINKSMDEYFKMKLHQAMMSDPSSKMVKLYKLAIGGVDVMDKIYLDKPLVQAVRGGQLNQALAATIQFITSLLSDWTLHPPFFVRQFANSYVYPTLYEIKQSRTIRFSTPLLLVMPAFNKMPHATVIEKEVLAMIKRSVTGTVSIKKDIAVILEGRRIKTFDGIMFDISEPPMLQCTYLLGADFKSGQFALTLSKEGVTAVSTRHGLTLARDGSVVVVGDSPVSHLPYTSPDGQLSLTLHQGELHLTIADGLADMAFSPDSDFYLMEMDRALNNASLGLLGTNNFEGGDDLRLPDGTLSEADGDFQNNYELTGTEECSVSSQMSHSSCKKFNFSSCMSLSDQWSPVIPCLLILNPQPFILQCQVAECEGRSGCSAVSAFLAACRHRGIEVAIPPMCGACQQRSGLDLVIVQSLHHSMMRDSDPLATSKTLVDSMNRLDLQVGVVTYGGNGSWEMPRSLLLNGKLLETGKKAASHMKLTVTPGREEKDADAAILAAADFPFRSQATKIILLMYPHKTEPEQNSEDKTNLLEKLKSRGITFVSASTYSQFVSNRVWGLLSTGEVIGRGKGIQAPQDVYSELVTSTSGLWLDMDTLIAGRTRRMRRVVSELNKLHSEWDQDCPS